MAFKTEGFTLSPQQRRARDFLNGNATTRVVAAVRLSGECQPDRLRECLEKAIQRHEILRTRIVVPKFLKTPLQLVVPVGDFSLQSGRTRESEIEGLLAYELTVPIDGPDGRDIRFLLHTLDSGDYLFVLNLPSLYGDGISLINLCNELFRHMDDSHGQGPRAGTEPVQYSQYSEWLQQVEEEDEDGQAFWIERLGEYSGTPQAVTPARPSLVTTAIEASLLGRIGRTADAMNQPLRLFLLTIWHQLLARLENASSLTLAVACDGRNVEELHACLGPFVQCLPVRAAYSPNERLQNAVARLADAVAIAEEWQLFYGFAESGEWPAQEFGFGFLKAPTIFSEEGPRAEYLAGYQWEEPFSLKLGITELDRGLQLCFYYDETHYTASRIQGLAERYRTLLEAAVSHPRSAVGALPLLSGKARERVLFDFNSQEPEGEPPATLVARFQARTAAVGDRIALAFGERPLAIQLSFDALNRSANRLSHWLKARGIGVESLVGLNLPPSPELMVAMLATLKAGGGFLPLETDIPDQRRVFMLRDGGVRYLFGSEGMPAARDSLMVVALEDHVGEIQAQADTDPSPAPDPGATAHLMYTSGSTGRPKGVRVEHRQIAHYLAGIETTLGLSAMDSFALVSSPAADLGNTMVFPPLCLGSTLHLSTRKTWQDPLALGDLIRTRGIACLKLTPSHLNALLSQARPERVLPRACLILGGESSTRELVTRIRKLAPALKIFNHYGPTETTVGVLTHPCSPSDSEDPIPLGTPLPHVKVYLLNRHLEPLPPTCTGEIFIGGGSVARGYHNRPEWTAERFFPDPFSVRPGRRLYRTGDQARHSEEGLVSFLGRVDQQIKIRGYRVELGEIEARLREHPEVVETRVLVGGNEETGQHLTAYVQTGDASSGRTLGAELRQFLSRRLPGYMLPGHFVFLEKFPLTPNGKIDTAALPAPAPGPGQVGQAHRALPQNTTEETLSDIWVQVLKLEGIAPDDDFFAVGGQSLNGMILLSRINERFGLNLRLGELFGAPNIRGLARRIHLARIATLSNSQLTAALQSQGLEAGTDLDSLAPQTLANLALFHPFPAAHGLLPISANPDRAPSSALSFGQQRLWFLDRLEGSGAIFNLPFGLGLGGPLHAPALERALGEIIRRHEILRTTFSQQGDKPVQITRAAPRFSIPAIDFSGLEDNEARSAIKDLMALEGALPFDLESLPLYRVNLARLGAQEHLLYWTLHHIVSDAWSNGVLVRELAILYRAFLWNRSSPLPDCRIQYSDYARWQWESWETQAVAPLVSYWQARLAGAPGFLSLPTDKSRPMARDFKAELHSFFIGGDLAGRLKTLADANRATLFMTVLAIFKVLLARYAQQWDISVGTPAAHRHQPGVEDSIGFFINTLILRTDLTGNPGFNGLLARVRTTCLEAFENQDLPFEKLVEVMRPDRRLDAAPLFQVMFVSYNLPSEPLDLPGLNAERIERENRTSDFDLTLTISEGARGIGASWEFRPDLFERQTIAGMTGCFLSLLRHAAEEPDTPIENLCLLPIEARKRILTDWSRSPEEPPGEPEFRPVVDWIEAWAAGSGDAVAAAETPDTARYRHLTFAAMAQQTRALARRLRRLGAGCENRVGLCAFASIEQAVGLLAIHRCGGIPVPLDPGYPLERLRFMCLDADIGAMIAGPSCGQKLSVACPTLRLAEVLPETELSGDFQSSIQPGQGAYLLFTSGSTGKPKGSLVEHGALTQFTESMAMAIGLDRRDRVLQMASVSFDVYFEELFPALRAGGTVVTNPNGALLSIAEIQNLTLRTAITGLEISAAHWHHWVHDLVAGQQKPPVYLRFVLVGCEKIRPDLLEAWRGFGVPIIAVFGLTETTITSLIHRLTPEMDSSRALSLGRPLAGTEIYVLDRRLNPVPAGVSGELSVGGSGLGRCYWQRPALTAGTFVPHPFTNLPGNRLFRSGDHGQFLHDGTLRFGGRMDAQLKLRGFRIEPGEIEAVLAGHSDVREAAVALKRDRAGQARLVGYLVPEPDTGVPPDPASLHDFVVGLLPDYMIPTQWVSIDGLPLTPNGKIDREALPEPDRHPVVSQDTAAPAQPAEEILANLWQSLLGTGKVSLTDNFFELGGHSLLGIRLISRIREAFSVELPLRDLFEAPTIAQLAKRLAAARRKGLPLPPALRPLSRAGRLPLSFSQQRLWFLDQLGLAGAGYNIPLVLRLRGTLDVAAVEAGFAAVIRRHEVLRTTFSVLDGEPVQTFHPNPDFALAEVDLRRFDRTETPRLIQTLADREARQPFLLTAFPLLRVTLFRVSPSHHLLFFTIHHIIADEWSLAILVRELATTYSAYLQQGLESLGELPLQYVDYAGWQREWLQGETLSQHLAFWKQRLNGVPAPLPLPTDRTRPAVQSLAGGAVPFQLDRDLSEGLRTRARSLGTTSFLFLEAVFATWLCRITGIDDIAVGTPVANRNAREIEELIGFFVNTLVIRNDLSGNPGFAKVASRVRQAGLEAFEHQDLPFEQVVEALQPERNLSFTPIFQVMFVYHRADPEAIRLPGLNLEPTAAGSKAAAKFDLTLFMAESDRGMAGSFEYCTALFDHSTVRRFARQWQVLLAAVAADPDRPIGALPLTAPAERQHLLVQWNDTRVPGDEVSLHRRFEARSHELPERIAIQGNGLWLRYEEDQLVDIEELMKDESDREPVVPTPVRIQLDYRELDRRACTIATHLRMWGVGPEVTVGVCLEHTPELIACLLGVLKAGGAYLPLDPGYPGERLAFMLSDSGAPVLLTDRISSFNILEYKGKRILVDYLWSKLEQTRPADSPRPAFSPDQLAYLIYTSGSTGRPKGTMVSHRALCHYLDWAVRRYTRANGMGAPVHGSLAFDATVTSLWAPLIAGQKLSLVDQTTGIEAFGAGLTAESFDFVKITPAHLELLGALTQDEGRMVRTRNLVIGGEALVSNALSYWRRNAPNTYIHNEYGPTETVVGCCVYTLPGHSSQNGHVPIGRPICNIRLYVVQGGMSPAPLGVPGELFIGGAGVSRGYHARPALCAERFVPDPFPGADPGARLYRSGDLVRYRHDGNLVFLGRVDAQVNLRGFRIELAEIENALKQHPLIAENAVILREDKPGHKRLVAYAVLKEQARQSGFSLKPIDLGYFLEEKLPQHMVPTDLVMIEEIPLTPNGKVDRGALPPPNEAPEREQELAPPQSHLEESIAGVWREVLQRDSVSTRTPFFELGGHSVLLVKVHALLNERLEQEVSLQDLFRYGTIAALAAVLERRKGTTGGERNKEERQPAREVDRTQVQQLRDRRRLFRDDEWNGAIDDLET